MPVLDFTKESDIDFIDNHIMYLDEEGFNNSNT